MQRHDGVSLPSRLPGSHSCSDRGESFSQLGCKQLGLLPGGEVDELRECLFCPAAQHLIDFAWEAADCDREINSGTGECVAGVFPVEASRRRAASGQPVQRNVVQHGCRGQCVLRVPAVVGPGLEFLVNERCEKRLVGRAARSPSSAAWSTSSGSIRCPSVLKTLACSTARSSSRDRPGRVVSRSSGAVDGNTKAQFRWIAASPSGRMWPRLVVTLAPQSPPCVTQRR